MSSETQAIRSDQIQPIESGEKGTNLETLILMINAERLKNLEENAFTELKELKERQADVSKLHTILKKLNILSPTGELDLNKHPELKDLIEEAKGMGVEIEEGKVKYSEDEKVRLIDNIRMTIEDMSTNNEMQLQSVTRFNNERYESWQMAKSIIDPLDKAKKGLARALAGR